MSGFEATRTPGATPPTPTRAPPPTVAPAMATRHSGPPTQAHVTPASAVGGAMPAFSIERHSYGTTLRIGAWVVRTTKRPILNNAEIETLERELRLPLPEMTFGHNALELEHSSGARLVYSARDALQTVPVGEGWEERVGGGVQVSMADKWSKHRSATSALTDVPLSSKPVRPHDWTFSTTYAGSGSEFKPTRSHAIPLPLLARQDPVLDRILFYDDVALFEDELHDNGESKLNVRIRVMPHSFFILQRLFVRVDHVLFRIYDVRVYHAFGSGEVVREITGYEAGYQQIKERLEKRDDLSPLADSNFVYAAFGQIAAETLMPDENAPAADNPDEAPPVPIEDTFQSGKPWPGIGKHVEVLCLSDGLEAMEKLAV